MRICQIKVQFTFPLRAHLKQPDHVWITLGNDLLQVARITNARFNIGI